MESQACYLSPGISPLRKQRKEDHMSSRSSCVSQSSWTDWIKNEIVGRGRKGEKERGRERKRKVKGKGEGVGR